MSSPLPSACSLLSAVLLLSLTVFAQDPDSPEEPRSRVRDLGIRPGILPPGIHNAITDVEGVRVGHRTLIEGEDSRRQGE